MIVFKTLAEAIRAGFQICNRTENGYVVRTMTPDGWAMAVVDIRRRLR